MNKLNFAVCTAFLFVCIICASCKKDPQIVDFLSSPAFVIGKEYCHNNDSLDYWLLNLASDTQYGDTLVLDATTYTNVIKTKDLDPVFKKGGQKVMLQFHISSARTQTTSCEISSPQTYSLKEVFLVGQIEMR